MKQKHDDALAGEVKEPKAARAERVDFPYVDLVAKKMKLDGVSGQWSEVDEPLRRDVSIGHLAQPEHFARYVEKGWKVVGYGNLEAGKYAPLRAYLDSVKQ